VTRCEIAADDPFLLAALAAAPRFRKVAKVHAVPAPIGFEVITMVGGREETRHLAATGDWLLTNPGGESYLVPDEKFRLRYRADAEPDIYVSQALIVAVPNPFGCPVELGRAPGRVYHGQADCWFAQGIDSEGKISSTPYIIEAGAFGATYARL